MCHFDVVVLDFNMFSINGAEVLQEIHSYQAAYLPVVVISGTVVRKRGVP